MKEEITDGKEKSRKKKVGKRRNRKKVGKKKSRDYKK